MDRSLAGKRPCDADDVLLEEDKEAVRGDRRGRRQQIQRYVFRFIAGLLLAVTLWGDTQPFSHKKHAALKQKCTSCHQEAERADRAGFPALAQCKTCHVDIAERKIPLQLVHELPDFVFFSHGRHAAAKTECSRCHGNVAAQEIVTVQQPLKMKWCVDCHKQNKAAVACNTCHELGQ